MSMCDVLSLIGTDQPLAVCVFREQSFALKYDFINSVINSVSLPLCNYSGLLYQ